MARRNGKRRTRARELMGAAEVARELGINVSNVGRIAGIPEPLQQLAATRVWDAEEIREFSRERARRREGNPTQREEARA
jgi:hypothetical protein